MGGVTVPRVAYRWNLRLSSGKTHLPAEMIRLAGRALLTAWHKAELTEGASTSRARVPSWLV